jgi:hypothetical protein
MTDTNLPVVLTLASGVERMCPTLTPLLRLNGMRAFIIRRVELIAHGLGDVAVVGSNHCSGTTRVKEFLTRNGRPYSYIDLDRDLDREGYLQRLLRLPTQHC